MEKLKAVLLLFREEKVQEGNSVLSILILITTLTFEKKNIDLTLKNLYLELGQFSDVTIRKDLNRLCLGGFLTLEVRKKDLRTKVIKSTQRLKEIESKIADLNREY